MNPTDILNQLAADFTGSNYSELCCKYPYFMQEIFILLRAHEILTRRPLAAPQAATPDDSESPAALIWEGDQAKLDSLAGLSALLQAVQQATLVGHRTVFRLTVASKQPHPIALAMNSRVRLPNMPAALQPGTPVPECSAQAGECHPSAAPAPSSGYQQSDASVSPSDTE